MSEQMSERGWEWFGHAGHFICGRWCRFHLCTKAGLWLVSTVGQYVHPRHSAGSERAESEWLRRNPNGEEIGAGRFYETMVFRAGEPCRARGCGCGLPEISGSEVDMAGYLTAAAAAKGHVAMCQKWETRLVPEEVEEPS
jgi:hypothetical protein